MESKNEKTYLESLPIQELVDFRNELKRQMLQEYGFSTTIEQCDFCRQKAILINQEIERRKNLIQ